MSTDIQFALAVLRNEYQARRETLVNGRLEPKRIDNVLADLEAISSAMVKIERAFEVTETDKR